MHDFNSPPPPTGRGKALWVWFILAMALLGPALLAWGVRGIAFAFSCKPGPEICHGLPLGYVLHSTLDLAWFIGTNTFAALMVALAAGIAALFAKRPLFAALSLLALPLATLVLPSFAVFYSTYGGCQPNESGIGDCLLWGSHMGMAFHHAAMAPWLIYALMPYAFALSLMVGAIGFMFCRERRA